MSEILVRSLGLFGGADCIPDGHVWGVNLHQPTHQEADEPMSHNRMVHVRRANEILTLKRQATAALEWAHRGDWFVHPCKDA